MLELSSYELRYFSDPEKMEWLIVKPEQSIDKYINFVNEIAKSDDLWRANNLLVILLCQVNLNKSDEQKLLEIAKNVQNEIDPKQGLYTEGASDFTAGRLIRKGALRMPQEHHKEFLKNGDADLVLNRGIDLVLELYKTKPLEAIEAAAFATFLEDRTIYGYSKIAEKSPRFAKQVLTYVAGNAGKDKADEVLKLATEVEVRRQLIGIDNSTSITEFDYNKISSVVEIALKKLSVKSDKPDPTVTTAEPVSLCQKIKNLLSGWQRGGNSSNL